jgi:hypothetical protein
LQRNIYWESVLIPHAAGTSKATLSKYSRPSSSRQPRCCPPPFNQLNVPSSVIFVQYFACAVAALMHSRRRQTGINVEEAFHAALRYSRRSSLRINVAHLAASFCLFLQYRSSFAPPLTPSQPSHRYPHLRRRCRRSSPRAGAAVFSVLLRLLLPERLLFRTLSLFLFPFYSRSVALRASSLQLSARPGLSAHSLLHGAGAAPHGKRSLRGLLM